MNKIIKFRFLGIAAFLAMIAVFSVVVMFLWNALMPDIFGLPVINYWQSLGLSVLARILFGGLGVLGGGRFVPHGGQSRDERIFHHRNALREKWMKMSEEERKAFIEKEKDFLHFGRKFSRMHDFFDEEGRGRCGGGAPAEAQSAKADCDGVCQRQTPEEFTGRSFTEQNSGFPPHDKKGDGNE